MGIKGVRPSADANPNALLLLGVAHGVAARHKAKHFQTTPVGQGVGGVLRQLHLAPPPHVVVVVPDFFNDDLIGGWLHALLQRHSHGKGRAGTALQVVGPIDQPIRFLALAVL